MSQSTIFYKQSFEGDSYYLAFGYDEVVVKLVKTIPSQYRSYNPQSKEWTIADHQMEFLASMLRSYDYQVQSMGRESASRQQKQQARDDNARDYWDQAKWGHQDRRQNTRPPKSSPNGDWAAALFRAVGQDREDAVYRALSKVLHPDLPTGSKELMQALNDARRR